MDTDGFDVGVDLCADPMASKSNQWVQFVP